MIIALVKMGSFLQNVLDSFFLNGFCNAVFKACYFKERQVFYCRFRYIYFFGIAATSRKVKK